MKTITNRLMAGCLLTALALSGCTNGDKNIIGTGSFEADEVLVASEVNGRVIEWKGTEGLKVNEGEFIGQIDTTQLDLQRLSLQKGAQGVRAGQPNVKAQNEALKKQIEELKREKARVERLVEANVATRKQLDDLSGQLRVTEAQLAAQSSALGNAGAQVSAQGSSMDAQIDQVNDLIARSTIKAPIAGTLTANYILKGELAGQGSPLYRIANLDEMILRAYLSNSEVAQLKLGDKVKVFVDSGEADMRGYEGEVTWIASKSEFTPKTVKSRDERENTVYAVKVKVKNDGYIKAGMYGEIRR